MYVYIHMHIYTYTYVHIDIHTHQGLSLSFFPLCRLVTLFKHGHDTLISDSCMYTCNIRVEFIL